MELKALCYVLNWYLVKWVGDGTWGCVKPKPLSCTFSFLFFSFISCGTNLVQTALLLGFLGRTQVDTHKHTQQVASGRVISSPQRPQPTQHTTNIKDEYPCPQRDSNHNPSNRAVADLRLNLHVGTQETSLWLQKCCVLCLCKKPIANVSISVQLQALWQFKFLPCLLRLLLLTYWKCGGFLLHLVTLIHAPDRTPCTRDRPVAETSTTVSCITYYCSHLKLNHRLKSRV